MCGALSASTGHTTSSPTSFESKTCAGTSFHELICPKKRKSGRGETIVRCSRVHNIRHTAHLGDCRQFFKYFTLISTLRLEHIEYTYIRMLIICAQTGFRDKLLKLFRIDVRGRLGKGIVGNKLTPADKFKTKKIIHQF